VTVLVVDAQGGGLGRQLVSGILREVPSAHVLAVGTNTAATAAMIKAGAHEAATGENSVVVASRRADVIVGPLGIVLADAMLGEITPVMARAIGQARATRVLIPFASCDTYVAGVQELATGALIQDAVLRVKDILCKSH
jgi:hypothetical protein